MQIEQTSWGIIYDHLWQSPAITEKYAFDCIKKSPPKNQIYVAFPWATFIDYLQTGKKIPQELYDAYESLVLIKKPKEKFFITVCQHIFAEKYLNIFKACGINQLYWTHAAQESNFFNINILPFPLFPVIRPDADNLDLIDTIIKDIPCSFIGAYDKKYYQSDIRRRIFDFDKWPVGTIISERNEWHYQQLVYSQQLDGNELDKNIQSSLKQKENEFKDILKRSLFSLCPSGSGPNSIRLWESLAYKSIPIIFSDNLILPGDINLWNDAAFFFEESEKGLHKFIELLPKLLTDNLQIKRKQEACSELYSLYGPANFIYDILVNDANSDEKQELFSRNESKQSNNKNSLEKKTLIILDPGLKDKGSHHHHINASIKNTISANIDFLVLANTKANIDLFEYEIKPIFSYSIYDYKASNYREYLIQATKLSNQLISELEKLEGNIFIYTHSCSAPLITAISLALKKVKNIKLRNMLIELMFMPTGFESNTRESFFDDNNFVKSLFEIESLLKSRNINLKFATSNQLFSEYLNKLFTRINRVNYEFDIHPHVMFNGTNLEQKTQSFDRVSILCHAGDTRPGKGLEWLSDNIFKLLENTNENIDFFIQYSDPRFPDAYKNLLHSIDKLTKLSVNSTRLKLIYKKIDEENWNNFLSSFNLFLLPLEIEYYASKTSGIIFDVLANIRSEKQIFINPKILPYKILAQSDLYCSTISEDINILSTSINEVSNSLSSLNSDLSKNNLYASLFRQPHARYVIRNLNLS